MEFIIENKTAGQKLIRILSKTYSIKRDRSTQREQSYFDTFDWRLHARDLVLYRANDVFSLENNRSGIRLAEQVISPEKPLRFWWDCPSGPLREILSQALDVRALIHIVDLKLSNQNISILNKDQKTILRFSLESVTNAHNPDKQFHRIVLNPVRGYRKEFTEIKKILIDTGQRFEKRDLIESIQSGSDRIPGDYTSKISVQLNPDWPLLKSTTSIFKYLLNVMRNNEDGIKQDIDTEFLHDFRVSVRRTRSALTQIKTIFQPEDELYWKKYFSVLGKASNRLRDLDVYLLRKNQLKDKLPDKLRPELDRFFRSLKSERRKEFKKFIRFLEGKTFHTMKTGWEDFLDTQENIKLRPGSPSSATLPKAKEFILKKYLQVLRRGDRIEESSPDKDLHQLRIECKKLRYLLEFFFSLFPPDEIKSLISRLKKLQDHLGLFNDLSMQQFQLIEFLENKIAPTDKNSLKTAGSIGGLITLLNSEQREVRGDFSSRFREFSSRKNRDLFQNMFGPSGVSS
ncbi:CHAD domain-containing protein [Acidobacteriota bacterium]